MGDQLYIHAHFQLYLNEHIEQCENAATATATASATGTATATATATAIYICVLVSELVIKHVMYKQIRLKHKMFK